MGCVGTVQRVIAHDSLSNDCQKAGLALSFWQGKGTITGVITRTSTILLEGLKDLGNDLAWVEFDRRYRSLLMAVAHRVGLSDSDAEDAVQDTLAAFMEQYRHGNFNRQKGRLRDWLAGIMIFKARDIQRQSMRREKQGGRDSAGKGAIEEIEDKSIQSAFEEEWSNALLRQCLEEVRQEVSPQAYESFELFALHQWPARQVADRLGISMDLVYQNKRRVIGRIRQLLPRMEEIW